MTTPLFGKLHGDALRTKAELCVAEAALRFLKSTTGGTAEELFSLSVRAALLETASKSASPSPQEQAERGDALQVSALTAFLELVAENAKMYRLAPSLPVLGVLANPEQEQDIALLVCKRPCIAVPEDANPLRLAWRMARYNLLRCEQRLCVLFALGDALRNQNGSLKLVEPAYNELIGQLTQQRTHRVMQVLAMGTLLGEEAREEQVKLVKAVFGPDRDIVPLLHVDNVLPKRYGCSQEIEFRIAIDAS